MWPDFGGDPGDYRNDHLDAQQPFELDGIPAYGTVREDTRSVWDTNNGFSLNSDHTVRRLTAWSG